MTWFVIGFGLCWVIGAAVTYFACATACDFSRESRAVRVGCSLALLFMASLGWPGTVLYLGRCYRDDYNRLSGRK